MSHTPLRNTLSRATRACLLGLLCLAVLAGSSLSGNDAHAQTVQWGPGGAGGVDGNWSVANGWYNGTTQFTWANNTNQSATAILGGTASTITLAGATGYGAAGFEFHTSGYTLMTNDATTNLNNARALLGPIVLNPGVNLNLFTTGVTDTRLLSFGSISGGAGSSITIQGSNDPLNHNQYTLVVLKQTGADISVPVVITNTGFAGFTSAVADTNVTVSGSITNNTDGVTMLGAAQASFLNVAGAIDGSAGVRFASQGQGGAGTVTLYGQSTYGGDTTLAHGRTGTVRLGTHNALPSNTLLTFGLNDGNNVGSFDLGGFDLQLAGISTNLAIGEHTNGIANSGEDLSTLTIRGDYHTVFNTTIGTPQDADSKAYDPTRNPNIALVLHADNTGSLALGRGSDYSGGTEVYGGTLRANNTSGSATGTGAVMVNGGTLGGNGSIAGAVVISGPGSVIDPGDSLSGIGALLLGSDLNFVGAGTYRWQINDAAGLAGSGFDTINLAGMLDLSGASAFTIQVLGLDGSVAGDIANFNSAVSQSWALVAADSITGFNTSNFVLDTSGFSNDLAGGTFSLGLNGSVFELQFNSLNIQSDLLWNTTSGTWNTVGANTAWLEDGSPAAFANNDHVTFGNAGVGNVTVAAGVDPASITINNDSGSYTFSGGSIDGISVLTKTGEGSAAFTVASGRTGANNLLGGTIFYEADNALGSGAILFDGGTLTAGVDTTISNALSIATGSTGTISSGAGTLTLTNLTAGTGATFVKTGDGMLIFSNAIGGTTADTEIRVLAGTLQNQATSGNTLGNQSLIYIASGATLDNSFDLNDDFAALSGAGTFVGRAGGETTMSFSSGVYTFTGNITTGVEGSLNPGDIHRVTKHGGYTQALLGGDSDYDGRTVINAGTLIIDTLTNRGFNSSVGWGNVSGSEGNAPDFNFGTGSLNGTLQYIGGSTSTNRTADIDGGGATINVTLADTTLTWTGVISNGSQATRTFTKEGAGTLVLDAQNTFNGVVNVNEGTLALGAGGSGDVLNDTVNLNVAGGTFDLASFNETVAAMTISSGAIAGSGTLTVDSLTATGGSIVAPVSSAGSLNVTTGTTTLLGNSSFASASVGSDGLLHLESTLAVIGGLSLDAGGILSGSGTLNGELTLNGGTINPGNSPGTINTASAVLDSGEYRWEINQLAAGTGFNPGSNNGQAGQDPGWDLWNAGDVSFTGQVFITVNSLTSGNTTGALENWDADGTYQWLIATSTNGAFTDQNILDFLLLDTSAFLNENLGTLGMFALFSGDGGDQLWLNYSATAIPEPGSLLLAALGASSLAAGGWRRRRRTKAAAAAEAEAASL